MNAEGGAAPLFLEELWVWKLFWEQTSSGFMTWLSGGVGLHDDSMEGERIHGLQVSACA